MNIQTCKSFTDSVALYLPQGLFLIPSVRINITIRLPSSKAPGKNISNWELMERMRAMVQPETFTSLKVTESTSECIKFEGEMEDKRKLHKVISCLDSRSIKLNGYPDSLKVKASELKVEHPTRHTWDSFFRDTPNMDEMKPGERPDTIHLTNLPIRWFVSDRDASNEDAKPSESVFKRALERFGKIRCVDIPICDPYRKQMKPHMTGISSFSFDSELYFEGYAQYSEYKGFVAAMEALGGMKLLRKSRDGSGEVAAFELDFDRSKHLAEASIKRRSIVRERLVARDQARVQKDQQELVRKEKKEEAERRAREQSEHEALSHMQEREERRKAKRLAQLKVQESQDINSKIAEERKKLVKTQRKLQSIRLIEELFRRIQLKQKQKNAFKKEDLHRDLFNLQNSKREIDNKRELKKLEKALLMETKEKSVRDKLVTKYKNAQEQELEEQRQKLRKALEGNIVLRSVLDTGKKRPHTSSISSLSSQSDIFIPDDEPASKIKTERLTTPERNNLIKTEGDNMMRAYAPPVPSYGYNAYPPYPNHNYNYHQQMGGYYPRAYFPPQDGSYVPRGRGFPSRRPRASFPRGNYRGGPRMPYFDGPNANHAYYKYFKKLAEGQSGDHNDRDRSYSRSRSRSRRRSYSHSRTRSSSRSRSRSRKRSSSRRRSRYSRSRSRHSRSRSRNRRSRSGSKSRSSRSRHSRRPRSSNRSRSRSKSRSRSRQRKSQSRRSNSSKGEKNSRTHKSDGDSNTHMIPRSVRENLHKSKLGGAGGEQTNHESSATGKENGNAIEKTPTKTSRDRSRSWSLPKDKNKQKSWSKSPSRNN